ALLGGDEARPGRQRQRERRALALPGLDPALAVVVGGDVADDGEPEPGAAGLPAAGPVDPVEALEDALEVAGGDAGAVVAHGDLDRSAGEPRRDLDRRAGVAVLRGVVQQVVEGRHELAAVADDR